MTERLILNHVVPDRLPARFLDDLPLIAGAIVVPSVVVAVTLPERFPGSVAALSTPPGITSASSLTLAPRDAERYRIGSPMLVWS